MIAEADIAAAAGLLRVLANPARLRIALHLLEGECPVGRIEAELGLKQPNLSQHLGELRDAGLLVARRESRQVFYRVAPGRASHLLASLRHGLGDAGPARPAAPRQSGWSGSAAATFAVVRQG
ncbi:ArsR/SmtB family transcription factor [Pseudoroseomonas globiformis]|uniref:ArsR/SmtB family transcription factor n=1 Tax=Teichococcus globiformis TaxID=2307229 RepID=A0ABV7G778_9PROT